MTDIRLALMCGIDIPIPECQLTIHQPILKEIAYVGETPFLTGVQCLCIDKSMFVKDNSLLGDTTNFQIFMTIMSERAAAEKKENVLQACALFFPNYKITLTPRSLIMSKENETILIDEKNFGIIQDMIAEICCLKSSQGGQDFNPADAKAREIAEKLRRGRERIAAQNANENSGSVFSQYISALTVGIASMSLNDIINLTIYQLYDLVERHNLHMSWDIDIKARMAGATMNSEPDNWMKNIH